MKILALLQSLVLFLFVLVRSVSAWGKEGHEIIANIAYNILTNETRKASYHILFPSDNFNASGHMSPLASVANWADKVRYTKYFAWTTPLHYVDVKDREISGGCPSGPQILESEVNFTSSNCTFVYERDCAGDKCAVGAIVEFSHLSRTDDDGVDFISQIPVWKMQRGLRSSDAMDRFSNTTKRESLMFLIHIIGDIHQPLHVSRESDRGGNTIDVSFPEQFSRFRDERHGHAHKGWTLHSVWDTAIIQRAMRIYHKSSQYDFQAQIEESLLTQDNIETWSSCPSKGHSGSKTCTSGWAEESFEDALIYAYGDENGKEIQNGAVLTEEYFDSRLKIVERRLAAGGVRLAATLEQIYGTTQG